MRAKLEVLPLKESVFMNSEEEIGYAAAKYSFHFYG
nr:MAG TPA: hypothetical protein [Caudoviricetes sp.]